jgi:Na+:H+ antiporter, NhaA family
MLLTRLFTDFTNNERASGIVLIACTVISLAAANLFAGYHDFWHVGLGAHSLTHWINDGLMTIFFLLIGLELEREVYCGELSTLRSASLPAIAALGGMAVPAALYYYINLNGGEMAGIGIPMATDIAFALAVLSLVSSRVPVSLKIFLTALAVMDDLGAILIIAIFYTSDIHLLNLGIAAGIWIILFIFNRLKVHQAWPYLIGGVAMWYFMMGSGVHATITGVIVAFAIPFGSGGEQTLSHRLQAFLHKPVAFIILPLFALANTSIVLGEGFYQELGSVVSIGVMAGLFLGKPIGIFAFTYAAVKFRISSLAKEINWKHILGAGMLGGIGFTMSIFISLLAFNNESIIDHAKVAVLIASLASGVVGLIYLKSVIRNQVVAFVFKLRTARPEEHGEIGELMVRTYRALEGFPSEAEQPEYYKLLRNVGSLLERPETTLWVATGEQDKIAGAVVYFGDIAHYGSGGIATQQKNAAGFRLLAVDQPMQGKGIGRLLTQQCIDAAREQGRSCLILHSTAPMQTAQQMYERMGFVRSPELDFIQGEMPVLGFSMKF